VPFDTALRIEQRYFIQRCPADEGSGQAMIRSLFVSLQELNKGARAPGRRAEDTKFKKIGGARRRLHGRGHRPM
jgi:3-hydroxyacyl-CoA dehydrogenase/enoyl-CoA hydratase/3-hydroxybutyryl-CoA epimerase